VKVDWISERIEAIEGDAETQRRFGEGGGEDA
jgi:hypothetical protein